MKKNSGTGANTAAVLFGIVVVLLINCIKPLPEPLPVRLVSPVNDTILSSQEITFVWESSEGTAEYVLQVAPDSKFRWFAIEETVFQNSARCCLRTDGKYWWRVRAQGKNGVWGEWGEPACFTLKRFTVLNSVKTQGYPHDFAVQGNYLYVADGQAGLAIYDISDPKSPKLSARIMDSLNVVWGVEVRDSLAFLAYGYKELVIVNTSDHQNPKIVGILEYPQPGYGYDLALQDSWVYVAAEAQFIAVNISDPHYPNLRFQYYYPRNCRSLTIDHNRNTIYVACEQLGIASWRGDTFPPIPVGYFDTPGNARGVVSADSVVMIADGRNGLIVVDAREPELIRQIGYISLPGYASSVTVSDSLAFVACGSGGVNIVNWATPPSPFVMGQIPTPYAYKAGALPDSEYFIILDRDLGIVIVKKEF